LGVTTMFNLFQTIGLVLVFIIGYVMGQKKNEE
jgi:hypothetical protein